jgi:hypothetical protein
MAKKSYLKLINMKELGRNGGKARAAKMTPKQRTNAARKAAQARWAKAKESAA